MPDAAEIDVGSGYRTDGGDIMAFEYEGTDMLLLFCNVGWMKHYQGIDGDSIERGGEYNQHSVGHEVCNFSSNRRTLYGYVQPTGQRIKLEKLGARKTDNRVDRVTVVWTAGPPSGGTVVVGWYKGATVYRDLQTIDKPNALQKRNGVTTFRIKAPADRAVLLPVEQRDLMIPRGVKGGIGQSNVWFSDKQESQQIVEHVLDLVRGDAPPTLPDIDLNQSIIEGNPRLVAHLRRERKSAIVKAKKAATLRATGRLCCEACGFDFQDAYGNLGEGFCEVHHLQPLSKADGVVRTELADLAIVCSNCHRVLHRSNPMLSIPKLSKHIKGQRV